MHQSAPPIVCVVCWTRLGEALAWAKRFGGAWSAEPGFGGAWCWMLDVGRWMLDVGCWMLGVGCWTRLGEALAWAQRSGGAWLRRSLVSGVLPQERMATRHPLKTPQPHSFTPPGSRTPAPWRLSVVSPRSARHFSAMSSIRRTMSACCAATLCCSSMSLVMS
jgi:hypothetical protein